MTPPQTKVFASSEFKEGTEENREEAKPKTGKWVWVILGCSLCTVSDMAVWQTRRWSQVFLDLYDVTGRKAPKQQRCLTRRPKKKRKKKEWLWIYWLVATRGQHGLSILTFFRLMDDGSATRRGCGRAGRVHCSWQVPGVELACILCTLMMWASSQSKW